MTLLDRYWIVFKFKLFKRLGLLINRVDTVLLSGQYQAITIIRLIIFILALMTFFNQGVKDFLMGLQYGLSGDGASVETLSDGIVVGTSVIWLSILACFDNSILTRLRFAQRFIWLREPIDGFDNFKHFFGQTLIRKILIEVFVTLGIYVMLIISLAPSFKISVFLLLGFFAFKGFSILLGLIMIDRINSKVIYWVVAISYALYFGFWIFLAINIEVSDLVALSLVIILTASFFTLGYKRFLNEPVINS